MSKLNTALSILIRFKYLIVITLGIVFLGFLDSNSFYRIWEMSYEANNLRSEITKYNKKYINDRKQLHDLQRNPKNITKIARERYFMKADDEDIFVLSTDQKRGEEDGNE